MGKSFTADEKIIRLSRQYIGSALVESGRRDEDSRRRNWNNQLKKEALKRNKSEEKSGGRPQKEVACQPKDVIRW